jgi:hypothetical protein
VEVPPAVVVDAHDVCSNLEQAQDALRAALGASNAPEAGWRLRVFDERRGTHIIVTANLDDAQGNAVAHRVIDATASDRCDGVISALGVWAGLVLDAEAAKAKAHPKASPPASTVNPSTTTNASTTNPNVPLIQPGGELNPDAGAPPPHRSTIEIGASGTLQNSPLTLNDSALVGGQVFALLEVARSFFLRPTLGGAGGIGSNAIYVDGRLDACLRVPGNYVEHRGLLLDMCAGTELAAFNHITTGIGGGFGPPNWDAIFSIGPTIGLRGDLASDLSVEVRGLAGFNILHTGDAIELLCVRAEVGLTWRLR